MKLFLVEMNVVVIVATLVLVVVIVATLVLVVVVAIVKSTGSCLLPGRWGGNANKIY